VGELRDRSQLRKRAKKAVAAVDLTCTRVVALCSEIAAIRHEGADGASLMAWLAVRGVASAIASGALPFIKWADRAAPPAELVRFIMPITPPRSLHGRAVDVSLAPAIAGVFLRSAPLRVVIAFLVLCGLVVALLLMFDVCSNWWVSLFALLSWPGNVCYIASLNRVSQKRLSRTFQTGFLGFNSVLMVGAMCFLWRNYPPKIAAIIMLLPCWVTAMFLDGYPELGRRVASLCVFVVAVIFVALLQAGVAFSWMRLDDYSFELIPGRPTNVTSIASGSMVCMLTFGLKNVAASLLRPGSLVVVKDDLRSLTRPPHALQLARKAHALLTIYCSKYNATLERELQKSNESRRSIIDSFHSTSTSSSLYAPASATLSGAVCPVDSLPLPADAPRRPLAAKATRAWAAPPECELPANETPRIGVFPAADECGADSSDSAHFEATAFFQAHGSEHVIPTTGAVRALAAQLVQECRRFERAMRDVRASGNFVATGTLATLIRDASVQALEAVEATMAIGHMTDFAVDKAALSICHVSSARPHEVRNGTTLLPRLSAFFIEHPRLRLRLRLVSNVAWLLGATVTLVMFFDAHYALWMALVPVFMVPTVVLMMLAFNRELLKGIAATFQTALVLGHTMVMISSFCVLFPNQRFKLSAIVLCLPSFICAAFIDAYPEEGRVSASRLFFMLNLLCLLALQAGLAFGASRIDEFRFQLYGGWSFKASELAGGAISSLIPFALRNLAASIQRPRTLAVRQSDVVCVYLDEHTLALLSAVHAFLMDDATFAGEPGQLATSVAQLEGASAAGIMLVASGL
jgi:hypothetical protein